LVSSVENAYWELYFAYRDLDAKIAARDRALETWREVHTYFQTGRLGGAADQEAQAREQYFRLEAEVQTALAGKLVEKTNANVFRGIGGVYYLERRFRYVVGLPSNDGELLRPTNEPSLARIEFDWQEVVAESLARRSELRKQRWVVRRRELELTAARGHVQPQLDAVARYRFRGLGHDLTNGGGASSFDSAYGNLADGDFQEWMLGAELNIPIGYRRELSGVRNAELRLSRDRAVLVEQEREVISDISCVYAESKRAYSVAQTNYNRRAAAHRQLDALKALFANADENEKVRLLDLLLDAQRRFADAESQYFRAVAEYAFAIKNIHYEKGSLLEFYGIQLAEGPWPSKACFDAARRTRSRSAPVDLTCFVPKCPPVVSRGPATAEMYPAVQSIGPQAPRDATTAVTRLPEDNGS
ncbi:MAG: TolC family protein, partial [Pirellulales bacterium]